MIASDGFFPVEPFLMDFATRSGEGREPNEEALVERLRQFVEKSTRTFDVIFASGVLYHMTDPAKLLFDMSRRSNQLFVWTHYVDAVNIDMKPAVKAHFGPAQVLEWDGCRYEQYTYSYQHALDWNGFCGGSAPAAAWLTRDSILNLLQHCGFGKVTIGFDHPDHPHGPAFGLVAHRG